MTLPRVKIQVSFPTSLSHPTYMSKERVFIKTKPNQTKSQCKPHTWRVGRRWQCRRDSRDWPPGAPGKSPPRSRHNYCPSSENVREFIIMQRNEMSELWILLVIWFRNYDPVIMSTNGAISAGIGWQNNYWIVWRSRIFWKWSLENH